MTDQDISPLRRRMIEDMEVRGFTACTQRGCLAPVRDLYQTSEFLTLNLGFHDFTDVILLIN